jgi:hypothetical protein
MTGSTKAIIIREKNGFSDVEIKKLCSTNRQISNLSQKMYNYGIG